MSSQTPSYRGYRFPSEIISHAVWLYHRCSLSFRDAEDLHRLVHNLFRTGRHLLRAVNHRCLRARAFGVWHEVTCA